MLCIYQELQPVREFASFTLTLVQSNAASALLGNYANFVCHLCRVNTPECTLVPHTAAGLIGRVEKATGLLQCNYMLLAHTSDSRRSVFQFSANLIGLYTKLLLLLLLLSRSSRAAHDTLRESLKCHHKFRACAHIGMPIFGVSYTGTAALVSWSWLLLPFPISAINCCTRTCLPARPSRPAKPQPELVCVCTCLSLSLSIYLLLFLPLSSLPVGAYQLPILGVALFL